MTDLTPPEIVKELDRFIIGQNPAKRAVAIALRNRWRRKHLSAQMREEVVPKNILMIGSTGVGKTEISRRLAKLANAPFIKVEATKFTEVGYVGRDVEQIIRDLLEIAIDQVTEIARSHFSSIATNKAVDSVIKAMQKSLSDVDLNSPATREQIIRGDFDQMKIEIEMNDNGSAMPNFEIPGMPNSSISMMNLGEVFSKLPGQSKPRRKKSITVGEAKAELEKEYADELIDQDEIVREAISICENSGIVFIDEIDKVCRSGQQSSADISREGVQRDLLPLIEGTTVSTKRGAVNTSHILFITSGAFHLAKPSDMLPELQGRLPIRVELTNLTTEDFARILTVPEHSLCKQYEALLATEGLDIKFTPDAVQKLAEVATLLNNSVENIGARRLHTVMERVLDDINFNAAEEAKKEILIDARYIDKHLGNLLENGDLKHFVL